MMRKFVKLSLLTLSLFSLIGCQQVNAHSENDNKGIESKKTEEKTLSYNQYEKLFKNMVKDVKVPGYTLKSSTSDVEVLRLSKDFSFGKREYMTTKGTFNGEQPKSTQESLFYESSNKDRMIIVTIAYTKSFIGNDMASYSVWSDYGLKTSLIDKTDLMTITYKNLIITIIQTNEKKAEPNDTQNATRTIVKYLKDYKE